MKIILISILLLLPFMNGCVCIDDPTGQATEAEPSYGVFVNVLLTLGKQ